MDNDLNKEKDLLKRIQTAVKFEKQLNTSLTEEDKIHINEITSELSEFVKKNRKSEVKRNFFSKLKLPTLNFRIISSAMASLAIGFVIGQQFLIEEIVPSNDQFLPKSIDLIEKEKLISLAEKLEPGKRLAIDLNENILFTFSMSEKPIEGREKCHLVDLKISGLIKSDSVQMIACASSDDNKGKWNLTDIK